MVKSPQDWVCEGGLEMAEGEFWGSVKITRAAPDLGLEKFGGLDKALIGSQMAQ